MQERPITRGDCARVPRPCGFEVCRYHLGAVRMGESCALDVADGGEHSIREVGDFLGVSHAMIVHNEARALTKLRIRGGLTA